MNKATSADMPKAAAATSESNPPGRARYLTDAKPRKLGELDVSGKKLSVWEIEVDDASVDAKSLIELTDEFRPGCCVFATVLFNQLIPTYDRWAGENRDMVSCPLTLTSGQWIAAKQKEAAPWKHYYLVEATPNRLVAVAFSALPTKALYVHITPNDLRSSGMRLPSVEPALKFKFLRSGQAGLVALIQPAFTRYGIRCETARSVEGAWEKTRSDALSRSPHGIRSKADWAKMLRVADFVGGVLDAVLAKDPNWTPKAQKFEAYFDRFNPRTADWLQTELLTTAAESDTAELVEFIHNSGALEGREKALASKKEQASKRRLETMKKKAAGEMLAAPPSPPRTWTVEDDGIRLEGPWDAVLGKHLREMNAKWLKPGWRVSLRRARAVAELLREYPELEAQRQELLRPAMECLASVPMPTGYSVDFCDWHLEVTGCGNARLDELLTRSFGDGYGLEHARKTWWVSPERSPELADALQQHPPAPRAPEPEPVTEAEAAAALRGARMPPGYNCQVCQNGILLEGPYLEGLVGQLRALKGVWSAAARHWTVPLRQASALVQALRIALPNPAQIAEASSALAGVTAPEASTFQVCQDGIYVTVPEVDGLRSEFKRLGAWWDAPNGRWHLRTEVAGALGDLFRLLPEQAAQASRILAATPMPKGYACQVSSACICVSGPKDKYLLKRFRDLNGSWHHEARKWSFSLGKASKLAQALAGRS